MTATSKSKTRRRCTPSSSAPPAHGQLTFNADGSFSYMPDADFLGTDSFTYSAVDHFNAVGAPTTVTLTVAIKSVSQSVASGTVSTGTGVSAGDPLNTAVTTSQPAIVTIAQGVIADSTSPTGFTFLNQQVNITLTHPTTGLEVTATDANPLVFTFEIDLSLIPPGQTEQTFQIFRNGVVVPDCLGATTIPAGMRSVRERALERHQGEIDHPDHACQPLEHGVGDAASERQPVRVQRPLVRHELPDTARGRRRTTASR